MYKNPVLAQLAQPIPKALLKQSTVKTVALAVI